MNWSQSSICLTPKQRGFHLITEELLIQLPEINRISVGLLHLFIQHTSASLMINENADCSVRVDMEGAMNRLAPEGHPAYEHTDEGPDDMPANIKANLLGTSLSIPIKEGRLLLGTWQGIWLGEHRNHAGSRSVIATLNY